MVFCSNCGGSISPVDKFCAGCGAANLTLEPKNAYAPVPTAMASVSVVPAQIVTDKPISAVAGIVVMAEREIIIYSARYGWAGNGFQVTDLGNGGHHGGGAKDVTDIVKSMIQNNELHINPGKQSQYMVSPITTPSSFYHVVY